MINNSMTYIFLIDFSENVSHIIEHGKSTVTAKYVLLIIWQSHWIVQFLDITTALSNVDYVTSALNKLTYLASKAAKKSRPKKQN